MRRLGYTILDVLTWTSIVGVGWACAYLLLLAGFRDVIDEIRSDALNLARFMWAVFRILMSMPVFLFVSGMIFALSSRIPRD